MIDQITLDSRFTASRLEIVNFTGRAGRDGSITATGGVDLSAARSFPVDVRLQMKNAQLVNRDDLTATTSGNVRIATDEYGGVVSGKLNIDRATYRIGRTSVAEVPVLLVTEKNAQALGRRVQAYTPPTRWLLDLDVRGDRRLFVQGMGITSEWSANVRVKGTATAPEVTGRVELVRGDYDFAGKRFSLTKGDVRFQGQFPPDPIIDIVAESSANGFTAQLSITGTTQKPEIKFSSVPSLPEDEVLQPHPVRRIGDQSVGTRSHSAGRGAGVIARRPAAEASTRSARCERALASTGCASCRPIRRPAARPRSRRGSISAATSMWSWRPMRRALPRRISRCR